MLRRVYRPHNVGFREPRVLPGSFRLIYQEKSEGTLYILGKHPPGEPKKPNA